MILGAGHGTRLQGVTKGLPKALVDVAGTPALLWIIASLLKNGVHDYVIVVSPLAERSVQRMCERTLSGIDMQWQLAVQEDPLGPGQAVAEGLRKVDAGRGVLVALCDTLFDESLPFDQDWVGIAEPRGFGGWCWAESQGNLLKRLYDKITPPRGVIDVLIGLYFFEDDAALRCAVNEAVSERTNKSGEIQISWAIERYMNYRDIHVHLIDTWVDCGTQENWLQANEKMFRHRHTHELYLRHDDNGVRIVKDTGNSDQLSAEVEWFSQVGKVASDLIPSVSVTGVTEYESTYLEMKLLSTMYLYEAGGDKAVVDHAASLLTTLSERLWPHASSVNGVDMRRACAQMYQQKPAERLVQWSQWERICGLDRLVVNGRVIDNLVTFLRANVLDWRRYQGMEKPGWIHGDLHFGNIFFDSLSKSFKLIDPRGQFGAMRGPMGDVYYDLAKLRHSYAGMYDAIVAGLFDLKCNWKFGLFELQIGPDRREAASELDALIVQLGFDLSHVKLLEVGIFLSLIPMHKEDLRRQFAFLIRALHLLLDLCDI